MYLPSITRSKAVKLQRERTAAKISLLEKIFSHGVELAGNKYAANTIKGVSPGDKLYATVRFYGSLSMMELNMLCEMEDRMPEYYKSLIKRVEDSEFERLSEPNYMLG